MRHGSTDALIARLVADARPVAVLRPARILGLLLGSAALLLLLAMVLGTPRPDLATAMERPIFWWKILAFALPAVAATVGVALALRPEARLGAVWRVLALLALAGVAGGVALSPGTPAELAARIWGPGAWGCFRSVMGMGLPMAALFALVLARGAATRPVEAARMAGLAAGGWGAAAYALSCPVDDPVYTLCWFTLNVGLVALLATLLVPPLLRAGWRRGPA